jgi:hypothetical protein
MAKTKPQTISVPKVHASSLIQGLVAPKTSARREGHAIPLQRLSESAGANGTTVTLGLDIASAPVPQRRYACEVCSVDFDGHELRLIFGQNSLGGGPLDTALVIRMSPMAGRQFAESTDQMENPGLNAIAENVGITAESLVQITVRPHQTANMVANFVAAAVSGYETCLDFYHASAFAMRNVAHQNSLELEPVVRVDMRTSIFMSLVSEIQAIVKTLPVPKAEAQHA